MTKNPLEALQQTDPTLFEKIGSERELVFTEGELSKKHTLLIAMAIDAALHLEDGAKALAAQALQAGASKQEILETLRIVNHICGVSATYPTVVALQELL